MPRLSDTVPGYRQPLPVSTVAANVVSVCDTNITLRLWRLTVCAAWVACGENGALEFFMTASKMSSSRSKIGCSTYAVQQIHILVTTAFCIHSSFSSRNNRVSMSSSMSLEAVRLLCTVSLWMIQLRDVNTLVIFQLMYMMHDTCARHQSIS
jgi:hypothetical protein